MDSADSLRPAVTALEWETRRVDIAPGIEAVLVEESRVVLEGARIVGGAVPVARPDALAAVALVGWFTWADVDRLREYARAERDGFSVEDEGGHEDEARADEALADRIAALLPPREER